MTSYEYQASMTSLLAAYQKQWIYRP